MKKLILVLSSAIAFFGMMPANAAVSQLRAPAQLALHSLDHVAARDAAAATDCRLAGYLYNSSGGTSWNDTSSPNQLYFNGNSDRTQYCVEGPTSAMLLMQYGTSRCLILDTSNRTITKGNCASKDAKWNLLTIDPTSTYAGWNQLENNYNKACIWVIYSNGSYGPATYKPCDQYSGADAFQFSN